MSIESQLHEKIEIDKFYARDVMIPRSLINYINFLEISSNKCLQVIEQFKENGLKFMLVCNNNLNIDEKKGICSMENICEQILEKKETINLIDTSFNLAFLVENQTLSEVIEIISNPKAPLGVVVDKIGEICGLVSKESIINFFAGLNISGSQSINRFINIIPKNIFKHVKSETIGGFIMEYLDKIPREGDNLILNNYQFTILEMNKNTIKSIAVTALDPKGKKYGKSST